MTVRWIDSLPLALVAALLHGMVSGACAQTPDEWPIHAMDRPQPPVVDPGPAGPPLPPPSDATVLFDGSDLSRWRAQDGGPAPWKIENGYVEVVAHTGSLVTRDSFGDVQLHIEWATPAVVEGEGRERGNSGVYRPPGEWQSYDVVFRAPRFDEGGRLLSQKTI